MPKPPTKPPENLRVSKLPTKPPADAVDPNSKTKPPDDIAVHSKPPAEHLRVKLYPNAEATEGNLSLQRTEGYLFDWLRYPYFCTPRVVAYTTASQHLVV